MKIFHFLKRFSLVQQLILVLCLVALIFVAVLMPIVDYNMNSIIDNQMYEGLSTEQDIIINYTSSYGTMKKIKLTKLTYHIIYDKSANAFVSSNIESEKFITNLYTLLFKKDLERLILSNGETLENKGTFQDETYYYKITRYSENYYLVSLTSSEYSLDLIAALRNQIIYIQYAFFFIVGLVLVLWVMSLINPLKKIKNYIDDIKNHKKSNLQIDREDEIGVVYKALIEMKEDLEKQEKIKEEMMHNISHDLKTPIALIQTYSQSVKDDVYPYGDKESSMDVIIENANRLEHKVKSFLYLNRLDYIQGENNEISSFNMKKLIEKVVNQMDALQPHISLQRELDDVSFFGDEEHWRIAIENIVENASRYAKTTIYISLKENRLEIYNDGEHINEEVLPYLFDPYVKGVKGQFGLGLSIVSKTASMYGYDVKAENKEVGVCFVFTKR